MAAEDREELILRGATAYFAEQGLSAGTIELATRMGITQPLLYKYFPTKEALIERVYERLLSRNWNPTWEIRLEDESLPLRQRLHEFYVEYMTTVLTYEHVRLFLFSGLSHNDYNARYYSVLTKRVLERIARALRRDCGGADTLRSVRQGELEVVQSLHAAIYHVAFRRWVHGEPIKGDMSKIVEQKIDLFLDGARARFQSERPRLGRGAR